MNTGALRKTGRKKGGAAPQIMEPFPFSLPNAKGAGAPEG